MKRSVRISILISMLLCVLLAGALLLLLAQLRPVAEAVLEVWVLAGGAPLTAWETSFVLVLACLMLLIALLALLFLFLLLLSVLRGRVFSTAALRYLLIPSLCCFAEAAAMLPAWHFFLPSLTGVFVFLFIGLCLLIVRSVIAEAMRIKQENDLTV